MFYPLFHCIEEEFQLQKKNKVENRYLIEMQVLCFIMHPTTGQKARGTRVRAFTGR